MWKSVLFLCIIVLPAGCRTAPVDNSFIDKTYQYASLRRWQPLGSGETAGVYSRMGDSVYMGEILCGVEPRPGIDGASFEVWAESAEGESAASAFDNPFYARDSQRVYYPIRISCSEIDDCSVCYTDEYIVDFADRNTFSVLGRGYGKDSRQVFFQGQVVAQADPQEFRVMGNGPNASFFAFGMDGRNVYNFSTIFKGADPATFYYDSTDSRNNPDEGVYIVGDARREWEYRGWNQITEVLKR